MGLPPMMPTNSNPPAAVDEPPKTVPPRWSPRMGNETNEGNLEKDASSEESGTHGGFGGLN